MKMALVLKTFSETETPNLQKALLTTAEAYVDLEEYRKYMVPRKVQCVSDDITKHDRIESKTNEQLKMYKLICQNIKDEVKNRDAAVNKEHKKQLELDKLTIGSTATRTKIVWISKKPHFNK